MLAAARSNLAAKGGPVVDQEAMELSYDLFCVAAAHHQSGSTKDFSSPASALRKLGMRIRGESAEADASKTLAKGDALVRWLEAAAPERLAAAAVKGGFDGSAASTSSSGEASFGARFRTSPTIISPLCDRGTISIAPPSLPDSSTGFGGPRAARGEDEEGNARGSVYPPGSAHWLLALCAEHVAALPREQ